VAVGGKRWGGWRRRKPKTENCELLKNEAIDLLDNKGSGLAEIRSEATD